MTELDMPAFYRRMDELAANVDELDAKIARLRRRLHMPQDAPRTGVSPLTRLRTEYVQGHISLSEFERSLEDVL